MPTPITTERLVLRPFRRDDVEDALAYRDDVEFARFLPHIPQPFTRSDAEAFVATNMTEPWDRPPTFAVELEGRVIGTVNFEVDTTTRTAMIGYAIGRSWWGRGIATEAARAAMAWAIEAFDLVRVWASTELRHVRSQRVMEKLGMRRESVRRRRATARTWTRSCTGSRWAEERDSSLRSPYPVLVHGAILPPCPERACPPSASWCRVVAAVLPDPPRTEGGRVACELVPRSPSTGFQALRTRGEEIDHPRDVRCTFSRTNASLDRLSNQRTAGRTGGPPGPPPSSKQPVAPAPRDRLHPGGRRPGSIRSTDGARGPPHRRDPP